MKKRKRKYQPGTHRDAFVRTLETLRAGMASAPLNHGATVRERLELETLWRKIGEFLADEFGVTP